MTLTRRYSGGLSASAAFAARRVTENRTVETYDREPTLWQTSQNARPWRLSGAAVYEFAVRQDEAVAERRRRGRGTPRRMADRCHVR